jgi:SAM-dependent methyltransferase
MNRESTPYKALCTEFYELDKPHAPKKALEWYLEYAKEANGPILEPMCGTGRFLIPILEEGYPASGFDYSSHMLDVCRKKCAIRGLTPKLTEATFETFSSREKYKLIFIPSGSFCLLTNPKQIIQALNFVSNRLDPKGKFVFEVETTAAVSQAQGFWKGRWVNREDGSKILVNTLSCFDEIFRIETILCRYELWEKNHITQTEVEDFRLKLYECLEIEQLLAQENFKVVGKWQAEPYYVKVEATNATPMILYECIKS